MKRYGNVIGLKPEAITVADQTGHKYLAADNPAPAQSPFTASSCSGSSQARPRLAAATDFSSPTSIMAWQASAVSQTGETQGWQ